MYAYAASEAQEVAQDFLGKINEAILFPLITLMMALALLIFLYGAFEYVKGASNDSDRETGKRHLLWGTIGMLVMLSAMSILYVAAGTFELEGKLNEFQDSKNSPNNKFFDNSYLYQDQVPSAGNNVNNYSQDAYDSVNDADEEEDNGADTPVDVPEQDADNLFSRDGKMSEHPLFNFHKNSPNAPQELKNLAYADLVANLYLDNTEIPSAYAAFEVSLLADCEAKGGNDVISFSGNNDMGKFFFCVK
jgi:hypothetical protein